MPELPEVESFRRYINKTSLNKTIEVLKLGAPGMLQNTTAKKLRDAVEGNVLTDTFRHGKFLFIKLKRNGNLMLHFGLTGDLKFIKNNNGDAPAKFALHFHFKGGDDLYFTDTRKMGKIALVDDIDLFIKTRKYGVDALKIAAGDFTSKIEKKRVAIKSALMDQSIVAGIGNEFSDEILFQAKIHPASIAAKLSPAQLKKIYTLMISILKEAVKNNADRAKLEHYFFLDNRKSGLTCPRCKSKTEFQTIGGRSSYFCPSCQKLVS
jgi:formamidopyrimidine-DNA glycosylase